MRSLLFALLVVVPSAACSSAIPVRSAVDAAASTRAVAPEGGGGRCGDLAVLASIEVYPVGLNPRRRFEAVGTVETGPQGSAMERVASLQAQACALGANAVIGWSEEGLGRGLASSYRDGTTILSIADGRPVSASGIAVVYMDRMPGDELDEDEAPGGDLWATP